MHFPLYIAKRYLFSKKTHNIINVISAIAVAGITVGSFALIVVLSVFNGFEGLVTSLFNTFNPEIRITAREGKTFHFSEFKKNELKANKEIAFISETIEENALLKFKDKQYIATIKGVGNDFLNLSRLDTLIIDGSYRLSEEGKSFAIIGSGVAYYLDLRPDDPIDLLQIYVPGKVEPNPMSLEGLFHVESIPVSGVFSVQQEFDSKYVIVPINFARSLLEYSDEVTAIEIGLSKNTQIEMVKAKISKIFGPEFNVQDRFEQQKLLYSIMRTEKWAIFLILTFILILASFNVIGSISILILDKKDDIGTLSHLGSSHSLIKNIFLTEGIMISLGGAIIGLITGTIVCLIQQEFGLIKLAGNGSFVIDAYPVKIKFQDIFLVFISVITIGFFTVWYPVHRISNNFFKTKRF